MTQDHLSEERIEGWRRNIRADAFANHHLAMGVAIMRRENPQDALRWFQAAESYPAHAETRVCAMIETLRLLGRDDEAQAIHVAALAADPRYEAAGLRGLADLHRATAGVAPAILTDLYERAAAAATAAGDEAGAGCLRLELATALLADGKLAEADAIWRAVAGRPTDGAGLVLDGRQLDARTTLALVAMQRKEMALATAVCQATLGRAGGDPSPLVAAGLVQVALECLKPLPREAQAAMIPDIIALVAAPGFANIDAVHHTSMTAAQLGLWSAAGGLAEKVLAARPGDVPAARVVARALLYRADGARALDALRAAGDGVLRDQAALTLLLVALLAVDRVGEAADLLPLVPGTGLDAASTAFYTGLVELAAGRGEAAAAALNRACAMQPDFAAASGALAMTIGLAGNHEEALRLHPPSGGGDGSDFLNIMRAVTLHGAGRMVEAAPLLQAALAARPQRVWFLARHFPRQYDLIAAMFRAIGQDIAAMPT